MPVAGNQRAPVDGPGSESMRSVPLVLGVSIPLKSPPSTYGRCGSPCSKADQHFVADLGEDHRTAVLAGPGWTVRAQSLT